MVAMHAGPTFNFAIHVVPVTTNVTIPTNIHAINFAAHVVPVAPQGNPVPPLQIQVSETS